jgi:cardiolipin synthase
LLVDGEVAYVGGLCVGQMWRGDPARGIDAWRDTGVEIRGPAVADVEDAFAQVWAMTGSPLLPAECIRRESIVDAGDVSLRVFASTPGLGCVYRLDQLVAAVVRERLWLTDAYFIGTPVYIQALAAASRAGVDVRLLVPGATDIAGVRALSRTVYRPLLEAGVRVFEWKGPMVHSKTAVADGVWSRVGSTNLNLASWVGNWELDVVIEDKRFAAAMEEMYKQDLRYSSEIVLDRRLRMRTTGSSGTQRQSVGGKHAGSRSRAAAGVVGFGIAVGAAATDRHPIEPAEAKVMIAGAGLLGLIGLVAVFMPYFLTAPLALFCGWTAFALLVRVVRAHRLRRHRNH